MSGRNGLFSLSPKAQEKEKAAAARRRGRGLREGAIESGLSCQSARSGSALAVLTLLSSFLCLISGAGHILSWPYTVHMRYQVIESLSAGTSRHEQARRVMPCSGTLPFPTHPRWKVQEQGCPRVGVGGLQLPLITTVPG